MKGNVENQRTTSSAIKTEAIDLAPGTFNQPSLNGMNRETGVASPELPTLSRRKTKSQDTTPRLDTTCGVEGFVASVPCELAFFGSGYRSTRSLMELSYHEFHVCLEKILEAIHYFYGISAKRGSASISQDVNGAAGVACNFAVSR